MRSPVSKHRTQRGVTLLESLVAMMILSFGMLGLVGLQTRLLKASTDAKHRVVAAGLADRLLSHALVDPQHASCYTEPVVSCPATPAGAAARQIVEVWLQDLTQLPSASADSELVTVPGAGGPAGAQQQLRVRVQWQGKGDEASRQVEAITDVRP